MGSYIPIILVTLISLTAAAPVPADTPGLDQMQEMKKELEALKGELAMLKQGSPLKPTGDLWNEWPSGRYCLLADGECPIGFCRSSKGKLTINSEFPNPDDTYYADAAFGDSLLQVFRNQYNQSPQTILLELVGCCRQLNGKPCS